MKRSCLILSLMLFTMLLYPATQAFSQARESSAPVLAVDNFMRNVDRHRGEVRVQGVVSAVSEKDQTLTLIDAQEFQECGVTTCAGLQLPVRWHGALPQVRDVVQITGQVQESDGKLLFVAQTLEIAKPQPKESK